MSLPPLSTLELVGTEEGRSAQEALAASAATVRRAEELGMRRVWFAEHHGVRAVASVSPPVLVAHTAATTTRIRVGSGGVLLPNHAPRVVAEQFATLDALHPGRIDLGIGRGPGTFDPAIVAALQRGAPATDDSYRSDITDLLTLLSPEYTPSVLPGSTPAVEPWLLSSSPAGVTLAAELGLPIAFAHHIQPERTLEALGRYRDHFRPSPWRDHPYAMICVQSVCAETDAEAAFLARPSELVLAAAVAGRGGEQLALSPAAAAEVSLPPEVEDGFAQYRAQQAFGTPATVAARLEALSKETDADEIMLATVAFDPVARQRSLELTIEASS